MKLLGSKTNRIIAICGFAVSLWLGGVATGHAVPVEIHILGGSGGGFSYSWLHAATSGIMIKDSHYFYGYGTKYRLGADAGYDQLTGEENPDNDFLINEGVLSVNNAADPFLLLSGSLDFNVAAGALIGALDYQLGTLTEIDGGSAETGTFYFYNYHFAGPANGFNDDTDTFALWGNNWANKDMTREEFLDANDNNVARGIDLGGLVVPVVPKTVPDGGTTALLLGITLLGLAAGHRCLVPVRVSSRR